MLTKIRKSKSVLFDRVAHDSHQCITHASALDRLADAELQHGHIAAAERLAHRAAEMREGAR